MAIEYRRDRGRPATPDVKSREYCVRQIHIRREERLHEVRTDRCQ